MKISLKLVSIPKVVRLSQDRLCRTDRLRCSFNSKSGSIKSSNATSEQQAFSGFNSKSGSIKSQMTTTGSPGDICFNSKSGSIKSTNVESKTGKHERFNSKSGSIKSDTMILTKSDY